MRTQLAPFRTTYRALLIASVLLIIAVGSYVYFFLSVQALSAKITTLQNETHVLEARESATSELKKNLANAKDKEQILLAHFAEADNSVPFFNTIEGYGKSTGVAVKFDTASIPKDATRFDVTISFKGSFSGVYRFLSLLEASPYEIRIINTQLQANLIDVPVSKKTSIPQVQWGGTISLSLLSVVGDTQKIK